MTMKDYWVRWTMEHHRFNNIRISQELYNQFSGGVREFLEKETDKNGEEYYLMLSLKYFFPAKPKPKETTKPLTK